MLHLSRLNVPVSLSAIIPAPQRSRTMALAAAQLAVFLGLLATAWLLVLVTRPAPAAPTKDPLTSTIRRYVDEWQPLSDPLVTTSEGAAVKSSNLNGFELDGVRYYYRPSHGFSYDPVSRGEAEEYIVVAVMDEGTPWEIQVYRLP